jgi:hypothetical protein
MPIYVNDGKSPLQSINSTEHAAINHTGVSGVPAAGKFTVLDKQSGAGATSRSYVVPGGTLAADNDRLSGYAIHEYDAMTGTTVTLSYGGVTLSTFTNLANESYFFEIDIWRTGASTQRFFVRVYIAQFATGLFRSAHGGTLALNNALPQTLLLSDTDTTIVLLEVNKIAA